MNEMIKIDDVNKAGFDVRKIEEEKEMGWRREKLEDEGRERELTNGGEDAPSLCSFSQLNTSLCLQRKDTVPTQICKEKTITFLPPKNRITY